VEESIQQLLLICRILIGVVVLFGAAMIVLLVLLYRAAMKTARSGFEAVSAKVSEGVGAGAKLLEVKTFYEETNADYQRILNQAHRDADKTTQDRIRRLIDRLNTLKARTLDKTSELLEDTRSKPRRKRRRRPRRSGRSRRKPQSGSNSGPSQDNRKGN
jgi:hypothetical protein